MDSLRLGCVKYRNARPLVQGWKGAVELDHPSVLCRRLAAGELDVALVSSFEFLRNPVYRIVDDVSISSDGPVYSVVLAHTGDLNNVTEVVLDPASATSVALLRYLIAERGLNPRFIDARAGTDRGATDPGRAHLLIGDQALRFRRDHPELAFWDLGAAWREIARLPFVYALWLVRPEVVHPGRVGDELRAIRDRNLANLDALISEEDEFDRAFLGRYYTDHLRFSFAEREKAGLQTFHDACANLRLVPEKQLALDLV